MKMAEELQRELCSINRKSYPAYKGLKGAYQFPDYQLLSSMCRVIHSKAPSGAADFCAAQQGKISGKILLG